MKANNDNDEKLLTIEHWLALSIGFIATGIVVFAIWIVGKLI